MTNPEFHVEDFASIGIDDFTCWVANEWRDGAIQALFTDAETAAGKHYDEARIFVNEGNISIVREALATFKTTTDYVPC